MELLPYQQKWLDCEAPIAVMEQSRQIGMTWTEAKVVAQEGGAYFASNIESVEAFLHECKLWAEELNLSVGESILSKKGVAHFWSVGEKSITGAIYEELPGIAKSSILKLDKRIVLDNFAFCETAQEVWNIVTSPKIVQGDARIRILSCHDGDKTLFHKLTTGKELVPGLEHHRVTLDDAIADGLYKVICFKSGSDWSPEKQANWRQGVIDAYGKDADEELFCIPKKS